MSTPLQHPNIDPVIIHVWGPFSIRWYSVLYVGGFLVGGQILKYLARKDRYKFTPQEMEQLVLWLLVGAVIGARIIYCFFYDFPSLAANPLFLFKIHEGGLSFHGGLLGVLVAAFVFARKHAIPYWNLMDAMAISTPIGLAMGRMGNFINGELYGRVSDVPWAMIFRRGGPLPRHPSQLYEFFLEGVILFCTLWFGQRWWKKDGQISLVFLIGYALSRFTVEFFREPDPQVGYLWLHLTMGQWLSIAMISMAPVIAWSSFMRAGRAPSN